MPRERLRELCDQLQQELDREGVGDEDRLALRELLAEIRSHLHEEGPGEETARLAREADSAANGLDPARFPGARLLGQIAEKLNEMGI